MALRKFPMSERTVVKLIKEVKTCPGIWDRGSEHYNDRATNSMQWSQISENCGVAEDLLRSKWKNLRDLFNREEKKVKSTKGFVSRWRYYKTLSFLKRSSLDGDSEYSTDCDDSQPNPQSMHSIKLERQIHPYDMLIEPDMPNEKNALSDLLDDAIPTKRAKLNEEEFDYDTMFLQSLTPFLRELEPCRKLTIRTKIQDIIHAELVAQNNSMVNE